MMRVRIGGEFRLVEPLDMSTEQLSTLIGELTEEKGKIDGRIASHGGTDAQRRASQAKANQIETLSHYLAVKLERSDRKAQKHALKAHTRESILEAAERKKQLAADNLHKQEQIAKEAAARKAERIRLANEHQAKRVSLFIQAVRDRFGPEVFAELWAEAARREAEETAQTRAEGPQKEENTDG